MSFSFVDNWIERKTGVADSDSLLKYQTGKAREIVKYVMGHSAFYKERLKNFNDGFTEIKELPFTFPEDIERFSPEMLCTAQSMVSRVVTLYSSGTATPPKRICFTEKDLSAAVDFFHHGMMEFTSEGDKVLILFPGEKEGSIGQLLANGLNRFGAVPLIYGLITNFDDMFRFISRQKINVIAGMPGQLYELSRLCRHKEIAISGLHSVLLSADYAAESLVNAIEKNLGCLVYEHYGMTEMCFGGGVYSKARDGYHMRHNDFLFEIVDPSTGAALPQGEYGEVVFTSLNAEAMPLIRYRTGDLARFTRRVAKYPVMEKIKGRLKDGVKLSNGLTLRISELEEAIFRNDDVLGFSASCDGNTLLLNVRSLRFDAGCIMKALTESPIEYVLNGCDIKILSTDEERICKNTMNKQAIRQPKGNMDLGIVGREIG